MSVMHEVHEVREASTRSLVTVAVIMIASALAFSVLTAPFTKLLGAGALPAAIHGLAAFLYLFIGTIGLYLGWRLLTGRIRAFADLQLLSVVGATMSLIAIGFGNWLYIFNSWVHSVGKLWMPGAQGIGPYSGKETLSAVAWLGSWAILHYALRERELNLSRCVITFLVAVGVATTLIWPPVFEYLAHLITGGGQRGDAEVQDARAPPPCRATPDQGPIARRPAIV